MRVEVYRSLTCDGLQQSLLFVWLGNVANIEYPIHLKDQKCEKIASTKIHVQHTQQCIRKSTAKSEAPQARGCAVRCEVKTLRCASGVL